MKREQMMNRFSSRTEPWEVVIIGGGATGVGIAVDAASRGYSTLLLEQVDFGKGTSSRSTKLVHGGVRYLQQGNVSLVMEALKERGLLLRNAPHLVSDLRFVVPNYDWWEAPFYGVGMKVYDVLSGKYKFGRSRILNYQETIEELPTIEKSGLRGGVEYHDGQFDDTRLLINLAATAAHHGAVLLNHARVTGLRKGDDGLLDGLTFEDLESGETHQVDAKVVINATGAFTDGILRMDQGDHKSIVAPSQGVHVVLDKSYLSGDSAIMVPHTDDGRVMFAVPWHNHTIVGTTDTPLSAVTLEPKAFDEEIDFILETAGRYLSRIPTRADVLAVFAGIRPLVRVGDAKNTAKLSRDHHIQVSKSALVTIAGGKWTTYRHMAEDAMNTAMTVGGLEDRDCITRSLRIHGYHTHAEEFGDLAVYGADATYIQDLARADATLAERLHPELPYTGAEVVWATRNEMARTLDDLLSRRLRATFLNVRAALAMAPRAAALMAEEMNQDEAWVTAQIAAYQEVAERFTPRT